MRDELTPPERDAAQLDLMAQWLTKWHVPAVREKTPRSSRGQVANRTYDHAGLLIARDGVPCIPTRTSLKDDHPAIPYRHQGPSKRS